MKKQLKTGNLKALHTAPHCSVILVTYNSTNILLKNFSKLISQFSDIDFIIVDNYSNDQISLQEKMNSFANVNLFLLNKNYGFSCAANFGAIAANTDWLIFVNPDVDIDSKNFSMLLELLVSLEPVNIYGSVKAKTPSGYIDSNFHRYVSIKRLFVEPIIQVLKFLLSYQPVFDRKVHYLDGSLFILRASLFHAVKGFPNFFMYGEDMLLNIKLKDIFGVESFYSNHITFRHQRSTSSSNCKNYIRKKIFYVEYSKYHFMYHHDRRSNFYLYLTLDFSISISRLILWAILMRKDRFINICYKVSCLYKFFISSIESSFFFEELHTLTYEEVKNNSRRLVR
jgi:GT2 family glycosyltransferase